MPNYFNDNSNQNNSNNHNDNKNNQNQTPTPNKPKRSYTPLIVALLVFLLAVGIFTYMFSGFNKQTYVDKGYFFYDENNEVEPYQGEIVNVLDDKNNGDEYGQVKQIQTAYYAVDRFYEGLAVVNTKVVDKKGNVSYKDIVYKFTIVEPDSYKGFIKYINETLDLSQTVFVQEHYQAPSDNSWIFNVLFIGGMVVLGIFLMRSFNKSVGGMMGGQNGLFDAGSSRAKKSIQSKVRFTDVAGIDEVKEELVEIVDYFTNNKKYTELGAKLPKGVLLVGPPGTGKTLLAKAVAGEANVPFYSISGSDFVEMYVGVGASRVRDMFKTAKQTAPCLVFIDEIDAVGRQRGAGLGGGNDEREQTLNQLLVEMDGFEDNSGVIIMAATNRSDVLDPALLRPGRFDRVITVDYPDKDGRAAILKVHARNKKVAPDVDFDTIAKNTVGFAGADLANIMNEAAILAVREGRQMITYKDIDEAIDRRIGGPAKSNKHLVEKEKRQIAYHEAGHAVIGLNLEHSNKVQKITIVPRGRTGGHVLMMPDHDGFILTKNDLLAQITGLLGGRSSEEIFFGDVSTGASNDFEQATNIARDMVTRYGMSKLGPVNYISGDGNVFLGRDYNQRQNNFSDQVALEIDQEIRSIIEECHKKAVQILTEHKDDVELIAKTVIECETINANEVEYLLKYRKMPTYDEHKAQTDSEYIPENPKGISIFDSENYKSLYKTLDAVMDSDAKTICLVLAEKSSVPLSFETLQDELRKQHAVGRVGTVCLTISDQEKLYMDSLVEHIESYTGCKVLVVKTDEVSTKLFKQKFRYEIRPKVEKPIFTEVNKDATNNLIDITKVNSESSQTSQSSTTTENSDSNTIDGDISSIKSNDGTIQDSQEENKPNNDEINK